MTMIAKSKLILFIKKDKNSGERQFKQSGKWGWILSQKKIAKIFREEKDKGWQLLEH